MPAGVYKLRAALELEAAMEARIRDWLAGELATPNRALGRPGALCPFVRPCLRAGALKFRAIATPASPPLDLLLNAAIEAVLDFDGLDWAGAPARLHCLIEVFPDLDLEAARLLDEVHRKLKDDVVARGLMFAQFHPHGREPSARNPELNVGRGPVPVLVFSATCRPRHSVPRASRMLVRGIPSVVWPPLLEPVQLRSRARRCLSAGIHALPLRA